MQLSVTQNGHVSWHGHGLRSSDSNSTDLIPRAKTGEREREREREELRNKSTIPYHLTILRARRALPSPTSSSEISSGMTISRSVVAITLEATSASPLSTSASRSGSSSRTSFNVRRAIKPQVSSGPIACVWHGSGGNAVSSLRRCTAAQNQNHRTVRQPGAGGARVSMR